MLRILCFLLIFALSFCIRSSSTLKGLYCFFGHSSTDGIFRGEPVKGRIVRSSTVSSPIIKSAFVSLNSSPSSTFFTPTYLASFRHLSTSPVNEPAMVDSLHKEREQEFETGKSTQNSSSSTWSNVIDWAVLLALLALALVVGALLIDALLSILPGLLNALSTIGSALVAAGSAIASAASALLGGLITAGAIVGTALLAGASIVAGALLSALSFLGSGIVSVGSKVAKLFSSINYGSIASSAAKGAAKMASALGSAASAIGSALGGMLSGMLGAAKALAKGLSKVASAFAAVFSSLLSTIMNAVVSLGEMALGGLLDVLALMVGASAYILAALAGLASVLLLASLVPVKHNDRVCKNPNYALPCPAGWNEMEGGLCASSNTYTGTCHSPLPFVKLGAREKSIKETDCDVEWPCDDEDSACKDYGGRDFSVTCPHSWYENLQLRTCTPPPSYTGACPGKRHMSLLSTEDKVSFQKTCGVRWPCKFASCKKKNYRTPCPRSWTYESSVCFPPKTNSCGSFRVTDVATISAKTDIEAKCTAAWPCIDDKCTVDDGNMDFSHPCPKGWTNLMGSGLCEAPVSYVPNPGNGCPQRIHFDNLESKDRRSFAIRCSVEWRCKGECEPDYSSRPCPLGWTFNGGGMCDGVPSYGTPASECTGPFDFTKMEFDDLSYLESTCGLRWPCVEMRHGVPLVSSGRPTTMGALVGIKKGFSGVSIEGTREEAHEADEPKQRSSKRA